MNDLNKALGAIPAMNRVNITKTNGAGSYAVSAHVTNNNFSNGSYLQGLQVNRNSNVTGIKAGWYKSNGKYRYMKDSGSDAIAEWVKDKEKWYYMDKDGYMVLGWNKVGSVWYYFQEKDEAGYMITGWRKIESKWYYFKEERNASGEPLGYMVTGWKAIASKWYYFEDQTDSKGKQQGYMITGWREIKDKWYYFEEELNANGEPLGYWVDQVCVDCELTKVTTGTTYSEVYVSARRPGLDKDGKEAPDLQYNDYDLNDLKGKRITLPEFYNPANYAGIDWNKLIAELTNDTPNDTQLNMILSIRSDADALDNCDSDYFFENFNALVKFFSIGEKQDIALDMVEHFKDGTGDNFQDSRLTKYAKEHENTREYLKGFKKALKDCISRNNGIIKTYKNDSIFDDALQDLKRPKFNLIRDIFSGLKITVDDTIGIIIDVENYVYCHKCKRYSGTLKIYIYDHFGLDVTDYNDFYLQHNGFGAWFFLQHYTGFEGQFRPFITDMKFEVSL